VPKKSQSPGIVTDLPGVAATSRALTILMAFTNEDRSLSLAEIARRTKLHKSTILRLIESLEAYDFLTRDSRGEFRLGMELIRLGGNAMRGHDALEFVQSSLERLVSASGESATFFVPRGEYRLVLQRVDSPRSIRDHIQVGDLLPLGVGAAGRVLVAGSATEILESMGERDPELAAVAGPVFKNGVLFGALQISGPISRFKARSLEELKQILEAECTSLSGKLNI